MGFLQKHLRIPLEQTQAGKLFFRSFYNLASYPDASAPVSNKQRCLTARDMIKPLALYCQKVGHSSMLDAPALKVIFESFAELAPPAGAPLKTANTTANITNMTDTQDTLPLEGSGALKKSKTMEDSLRDLTLQSNFEWNPEDDDFADHGPKVRAQDLAEVISGLLWLIQKISNDSPEGVNALPMPAASSSPNLRQHRHHTHSKRAYDMVEHLVQYNRPSTRLQDPIDLATEMIDFGQFTKYISRNVPNLFEVLSPYFYNLFLIGDTMRNPSTLPTSSKTTAGVKGKTPGAVVLPGASPILALESPSDILTTDHLALLSWFLPLKKTPARKMTNLYSGSKHGFSMNQFELHVCKYPAPTLLLMLVERQKLATPTVSRRRSIAFNTSRHRASLSSTSPTYSIPYGSEGRPSSYDKFATTPSSAGSALDTILDGKMSKPKTAEPESELSPGSQGNSAEQGVAQPTPRRQAKERMILGAYVTETWKESKAGWGNDSFALFELSPCFEVFPVRKVASAPMSSTSSRTSPRAMAATNASNEVVTHRHHIHFLKTAGVGFGGAESESCMLFLDDNLRYGNYRQDFAGGNIYASAGGARQAGFDIEFEVVECEVWGLGGPEAKARQQKEWEFEQREANRRASVHLRKDGEQEIDRDLLNPSLPVMDYPLSAAAKVHSIDVQMSGTKEGKSLWDNTLAPERATQSTCKGSRKSGLYRSTTFLLSSFLLSVLFLVNSGASAAPISSILSKSKPAFSKRQLPPPAVGPIVDPCTTLSQVEEPDITFEHVRNCYANIPFNATEAGIVLSTLYTLFRDYYVFLDYAMMPNQPKPFTNPPVDILAGLDRIGQTNYKSDLDFHTDIDLLVNRLNDAHANYIAHCYHHYLFIQPFDLYAPVVDGVQSIRILKDGLFSGLVDCEVVTIDGVPALEAIQKWVDVHYGFSKDAGVRLNRALGGPTFDPQKMQWMVVQGQFASRVSLPESQSLTYEIVCPASHAFPQGRKETRQIEWDVYRLRSWQEFHDTESYLNQNCYWDTDPLLNQPPKTDASAKDLEVENASAVDPTGARRQMIVKERMYTRNREYQAAVEIPRHETIKPRIRKEMAEAKAATTARGDNKIGSETAGTMNESHLFRRQEVERQVATLIYNGTHTAFYQLVDRPSIGVVVIPTHSVKIETESTAMTEGFNRLLDAGVLNIILDLTGNGGGYVNFAYDLVDWMFPDENTTSVYMSDLRASTSAKALADKDLEDTEYDSYFNPESYSDPFTGQMHETNFFLDGQLEWRVPESNSSENGATTRQGRPQDTTPLVYMNHNLGHFEAGMPWQHHAERMVVLTDGTCGSACGMTLNRLKNRFGVKSYAFGGRQHEPLSLFSFAGASVYGLDAMLDDFRTLEVDSPMQKLRYKGIYRVPVMEFFWEDDPVPIEYNPKMYAADVHLDLTPVTARNHEGLWEVIAENQWPDDVAG
ncbi:Restriction of telomere capping protein 5 [Podila epigama]|nr:Restriction of telomere capping protein 5 [Podila epigama]